MKMSNFRKAACTGVLSMMLFQTASAFQVNGYFENWAQYRGLKSDGSNRGFFPSCVPSGFSTITPHLSVFNYAFAFFNFNSSQQVTNDWAVHVSEWNDILTYGDGGLLAEAANLKIANSDLKIMLSIGGWTFCQQDAGSYGPTTYTFFSQLLANTNYQTAFINSLTAPQTGLLFQKSSTGQYLIDGVDIDYEYPGQLVNTDYQGYITFITALRTALKTLEGRPPCYLSVTLAPFLPSGVLAGTWTGGTYPTGITAADGLGAYSGGTITPTNPSTYFAWMSIIANYCDWVNLMAYDMYGAFSGQTGVQYQAPLYNGSTSYSFTTLPDNSQNQAYSIDYAVQMWVQGARASTYTGVGVPLSKIILGLPAYGRSYGNSGPSAQFPTTNPIGAPWTVAGAAQPFTQQAGVAAYFEIVPLVGTTKVFNSAFNLANNFMGTGSDSTAAQSYIVLNQSNLNPNNDVFVYDAIQDIQTKTAYASKAGLGGVVLYAMSEDNLLNSQNVPTTPAVYTFGSSLIQNGVIATLQDLGVIPRDTQEGSQTSTTNYSNRSPSN